MLRRVVPLLCLAAVSACGQQLTPGARRQIAALLAEKTSRTPAQAKLDSHLVHAAAILQGRPVHPDFPTPPGELESVHLDAGNQVEVDITAEATSQLLAQIAGLGGTVISEFPEYHAIRARLPLTRLEQLAGRAEVSQIRTADYGHSNAGPDTLGDIAHQAVLVRSSTGFDGSGVRIGVLSSGVNSLVAEQAAGRLPSTLNIIPGKAGNGDEGTAILEILYTLAPGATLYFATATGGQATMANNIQALADAGCNIILDDWTYFAEGVFQDDIIARKVNTLAAAGILYFSDAQNSGSVLKGNSGTWEGDFLDSGQTVAALAGAVHNFGSSASVTPYDALTAASPPSFNGAYELKWSDPLGGSSNDYDLFILDAGLTTVLGSSTNIQSGSQNPEEHVNASSGIPAGSRIIIVKHPSAAVRAMHLDTERGVLAIGTTGATFGHNAASGAFTMAAVDVQRANGGAFVGGASNYSYFYNSDGPRRMFYEANGTAVTPGNLLFATNGGTVLDKPDFTAADCVNTGVSGYTIFCGTSAAAPHAGAIAALVLQASPSIPVSQVRTAFTSAALDIEGPGWDINSGAGIVMAPAAVSAALAAQAPSPFIAAGGVVNFGQHPVRRGRQRLGEPVRLQPLVHHRRLEPLHCQQPTADVAGRRQRDGRRQAGVHQLRQPDAGQFPGARRGCGPCHGGCHELRRRERSGYRQFQPIGAGLFRLAGQPGGGHAPGFQPGRQGGDLQRRHHRARQAGRSHHSVGHGVRSHQSGGARGRPGSE